MPRKSKRQREHAKENIKNLGIKILWEDFVWVLTKEYEAKMINKSGSVRVFLIDGVPPFTAHEPHGREPWVSKADRERARWAIEAGEALQKEHKDSKE
jgi:hypothetical protein